MKNSKKTKNKDPHFKRESLKYDTPIPSREYILSILEELGRPVSKPKLLETLNLSQEQQEALGYRLKAMLRDGQLMQDRRGRFCLLAKINLLRGVIQANVDGYGFFIPDNKKHKDMFLSAKQMLSAMDGDIVLAYQSGFDRRGRPEAKIHEILEHAYVNVVGKFHCEYGICVVTPENKRLTQDIIIPQDKTLGAKDGQIVLVEFISYPNKNSKAVGHVLHIIGEHMAPGIEIDVALLSYGIPHKWSEQALKEASNIKQHISEEDIGFRKDLRDLNFVTIDGEDAKDFDDAVYCKRLENGDLRLYVAIADVSHYVKINSYIDKEAQLRGNSIYFPGKVVPMLPESLSNGICSLNPKVDRFCMVAEMQITKDAKLKSQKFYKAIIHSKARLTYNEVYNWLQTDKTQQEHEFLLDDIKNLYAAYKRLNTSRLARGAIEFDSIEMRIIFDADRKIKSLVPVLRNEAHKLIEECMLAANVCVAKFLSKHNIAFLYRVHPLPDAEKLLALRQFLGGFSVTLAGGKTPKSKDYQNTLNSIENRPEKNIIQTVMLRSLKQAYYHEENEGHFGLAYPCYTHFTSPIRRYPDLLVHRALSVILDANYEYEYTADEISSLGKHCSMTERRADDATRDVMSWLKCEYMQDKLGQTFNGKISSVTSFGLFVEIDNLSIEGLVHITALRNDYYKYDAVHHNLTGMRTGNKYGLGDKITIMVAKVNLDERKIDFELVD